MRLYRHRLDFLWMQDGVAFVHPYDDRQLPTAEVRPGRLSMRSMELAGTPTQIRQLELTPLLSGQSRGSLKRVIASDGATQYEGNAIDHERPRRTAWARRDVLEHRTLLSADRGPVSAAGTGHTPHSSVDSRPASSLKTRTYLQASIPRPQSRTPAIVHSTSICRACPEDQIAFCTMPCILRLRCGSSRTPRHQQSTQT